MKKKLIILGALFAVGVGIGYYLSQMGHDETADMEAAYTVTSDAIVQEFLDNEEVALKKYVDQVIEVSGPIFEVNKANGEIIGVKISSDEFAIVNCTFQANPTEMPSGKVTIKGVCSGFNGDSESMLPGGTVELNRSAIVNQKE